MHDNWATTVLGLAQDMKTLVKLPNDNIFRGLAKANSLTVKTKIIFKIKFSLCLFDMSYAGNTLAA